MDLSVMISFFSEMSSVVLQDSQLTQTRWSTTHGRRHNGIYCHIMKISPSNCLHKDFAIWSKGTRNTEVFSRPTCRYSSLSILSAGLRPFGVSLLYAGYDSHYHFQLYHSDPSGNYSGWKATCIGANNGTAQSLLKQEYKDDIEVKDAIGLVLRVMSKTMDSTTLGSEKRQWFFILFISFTDSLSCRSGVCRAHVRPGDQAAEC